MNERLKERQETDALEQQAISLGIDIPKNAVWWWDDADEYSGPADMMEYVVQYYLTPKGKAGVKRLIREERRKDIEWQRKAIHLETDHRRHDCGMGAWRSRNRDWPFSTL
jgi:hypothetical protein